MTREGQVPFGLIKGSHFQGSWGYNPRAAWEKFILEWSIRLKETFFIFPLLRAEFLCCTCAKIRWCCSLSVPAAREQPHVPALVTKNIKTQMKKNGQRYEKSDSLVTKLQSWQQHELKRVNQLWVRQMSEAHAEMGEKHGSTLKTKSLELCDTKDVPRK